MRVGLGVRVVLDVRVGPVMRLGLGMRVGLHIDPGMANIRTLWDIDLFSFFIILLHEMSFYEL